MPIRFLCVATLALCWSHSVFAQDPPPRGPEGVGPNQILVSSGIQANLGVQQAGLANAVSYRRVIPSDRAHVTLGPTFEIAAFDHWTAWGVFADLALWPLPHSELTISPGVKVTNRPAPLLNQTDVALRMTAGQELAFPPFTVMPRIGADFSAGTVTLMLGLGLGFRFRFGE